MRRILISLLIVAAVAGGIYAYVYTRAVDGPLSGERVDRSVADRRPIAVTIDNYSPDAWPQSGLDKASLVFETLAEGGITRFLAVYLEHDAATIGPVRSTRLYFNSWAAGLHGILGHDGGNVDAVQQLPSLSIVYNEDANQVNGPFRRSSARQAPHNEYTSTAALRRYAADHGGSTTGTGMSFPHKNDLLFLRRPGRSYLHVQFSYDPYNITWQYDPSSDSYLRFTSAGPSVEATTGKQLAAKNIVVMFTTKTAAYDPFTPESIHLGTEGTGKLTVYQDGGAIQGTWYKPSVDGPLQWNDQSGHPIPLNRGTTWVEVVPEGNTVSVSATP